MGPSLSPQSPDSILSPPKQECLTVSQGQLTNGTGVNVEACKAGQAAQAWHFDGEVLTPAAAMVRRRLGAD
jgi:hypothetical protein